jgi:hypothetical protein
VICGRAGEPDAPGYTASAWPTGVLRIPVICWRIDFTSCAFASLPSAGWAACVAFSFLLLCDLRGSFWNGRSGRYDTCQNVRCLEDVGNLLENRFCRGGRALAFGTRLRGACEGLIAMRWFLPIWIIRVTSELVRGCVASSGGPESPLPSATSGLPSTTGQNGQRLLPVARQCLSTFLL